MALALVLAPKRQPAPVLFAGLDIPGASCDSPCPLSRPFTVAVLGARSRDLRLEHRDFAQRQARAQAERSLDREQNGEHSLRQLQAMRIT